jgi:hypothetical protein
VERHLRLFLITAPVVVVLFSLLQGAYDIDPHHWGLMLSNAKDLYEGQTPYKDIFIQYGILTTILQAFAFGIGKNMLSIIVITSICYSIGILLIYAIALRALQNKTTALYVLILLVLFHPLAMYPWSNYIAFPFFMYGLYALIGVSENSRHQTIQLVLGSISLGLAVLAREGLAPAAILFILLSFAFDLIKNQDKQKGVAQFAVCAIGFAIPLGIFFGYLFSNGLFEYWVNLSIKLPAIYAEENFNHVKVFIFKALFKEIYSGYRHGDVRWILTSLILLANLWVFALALIGRRKAFITPLTAKISVACLLLLSSSLHLAETFRIATGSAVGLIVVFAILQSSNNKNRAKYFFFFFALWLGLTATYGNRGNYFYPTWLTVINAKNVSNPEVLSGQRWSPEMGSYYQTIVSTLVELQNKPCSIDYQINNTRNSLFKVISPIPQLQIAPFGTGTNVATLRPDIDAVAAIAKGTRLVILDSADQKSYESKILPEGFILYKHLSIPKGEYFMPHTQELLIYVPKDCAE